jgi:Tetracyclin repressor-like, C-terminal domain
MKRKVDFELRALMGEGVRDGAIHSHDIAWTAFTIAGSLNWVARWYRPDRAMSESFVIDRVVEQLIAGVRPINAAPAIERC